MNIAKSFRILLLFVCGLLIFQGQVIAQKTYFVYLQTDNQQPFYVTMQGKNISSSSIGYLILPKMQDSTYALKIGFPGSNVVQEFAIKMNGTDQGFLIKNFGDKGWGLFNLQSLAVEMSQNEANKLKAAEAAKKLEQDKQTADSLALVAAQKAATQKADSLEALHAAFEKQRSDSLAEVQAIAKNALEVAEKAKAEAAKMANDSLQQVTDQTNKREVATIPEPVIINKDSAITSTTAKDIKPKENLERTPNDSVALVKGKPVMDTNTTISPVAEPVMEKAKVETGEKSSTVHAEKKTGKDTSVSQVNGTPKFLDMELNGDTTNLVNVGKPPVTPAPEVKMSQVQADKTDDKLQSPKGKKGENVAGITSNNSNTTIVTVPAKTETVGSITVVTNNACKQIASEKDFFNVRKKMVSTTEVSEMVLIAKKAFKEKCFSSAQVRNLCVLFLDDAARYNFLDQVYDFTHDRENYRQLSDLLKEDYYIRRFNAMLK